MTNVLIKMSKVDVWIEPSFALAPSLGFSQGPLRSKKIITRLMANLGQVSLKHSVATGMSMKNICHCSIPVIFLPSGNEASFLREVTKKMLGHNKMKVKIRQARGIKVLVCVYHPSILTGRVLLLCIIHRLCKFQAKTNFY